MRSVVLGISSVVISVVGCAAIFVILGNDITDLRRDIAAQDAHIGELSQQLSSLTQELQSIQHPASDVPSPIPTTDSSMPSVDLNAPSGAPSPLPAGNAPQILVPSAPTSPVAIPTTVAPSSTQPSVKP